jgi:hypothetical protein
VRRVCCGDGHHGGRFHRIEVPIIVNRFTTAALVALVAVVVTACGSSTNSASPSQAAATTPSQAASAAPTGSGAALPSLPSSAKDLEALIPDKIGTLTLQKASMNGNEFVGSGNASQEAQDFLTGLGVSTDDVSVAIGFGADVSGSGDAVAVLLFRAKGASSDRLLSLFKEATNRDRKTPLVWAPASLGGKEVQKAADPEQGDGSVYLYATGDLLAFVTAGDDTKATEALSALP